MESSYLNLLIKQLKDVMQNKPLSMSDKLVNVSDELQNLQDAIYYLSNCIMESNQYLLSLSEGKLDAIPPNRHNYVAGYIKGLHSILKHLTWQTAQVANGDYKQRVQFLGEFSESFNLMVKQLEDREIQLKEKTNALSQSMNLLVSIMDTQSQWIIVMDCENHEVIYTNQSAEEHFYNIITKEKRCDKDCTILEKIKYISNIGTKGEHEFTCNHNRYINVTSYPIEWNSKRAIVHYITDITKEKESRTNLSNMAYKDELTGAYNRRYCNEIMNELIENKENYTLVLVDLDDLKQVNDTFGHSTGDDYLITVTDVVQKNINSEDVLCRIGGDEFIIIFRKCTEESVINIMKTIYNSLLKIKKEYTHSISYGITYVSQDMDLSLDKIIELSDSKMYEFKKNYKNKN